MNRKYPRLSELASFYSPEENRSRFYKFPESFSTERLQKFSLIEDELSTLDDESWCFLKNEAKGLCIKQDEKRGWSQLFEKLNEAKGYCFLKSIGCLNIRFIPRAIKDNIETPDLVGYTNTSQILCEVKTINISDELLLARENMSVMSAQNKLTLGLTNKLESTIAKAASQLNFYSKSPEVGKYIYLVVAYDDDLDYRNELNAQTQELFNNMNLVGIKLKIYNETR